MPKRERSMRSRTGPWAGTWAVAALLALAWPPSSPSQGGPPNLRPFQPPGWPDAIVVSNRQGDNAGGRLLQASDRLYVDFAVINSGESPAASPFRIDLYVDGAADSDLRRACAARSPGLPVSRGLPHRQLGGGGPTRCGSWPTSEARWPKATNPTTPTPGRSSSGAGACR